MIWTIQLPILRKFYTKIEIIFNAFDLAQGYLQLNMRTDDFKKNYIRDKVIRALLIYPHIFCTLQHRF